MRLYFKGQEMKNSILISTVFLAAIYPVISHSSPLAPIPNEAGFSGLVGGGIAAFDVKSNFLGGNRLVDLDNDTISSLSSPSSSSTLSPDIQFDVRYTFKNLETQLFVGNALADLVRLDFSQQLGIRHQYQNVGIVSLSYLFSTIPGEVWEDPFQTGSPRSRTDRDSQGLRLNWDNIYNSPFGLQYSYRKVSVDNELSGASLLASNELSPQQVKSLSREGHIHQIELVSIHQIADGHTVIPQFNYTRFDNDGEATAANAYQAQLSYLFQKNQYSFLLSPLINHRSYDEINPIFDDKADTTTFGISGSVLARELFWDPNIELLFGIAWVKGSSDINFYDSEIFASNLSLLYRF